MYTALILPIIIFLIFLFLMLNKTKELKKIKREMSLFRSCIFKEKELLYKKFRVEESETLIYYIKRGFVKKNVSKHRVERILNIINKKFFKRYKSIFGFIRKSYLNKNEDLYFRYYGHGFPVPIIKLEVRENRLRRIKGINLKTVYLKSLINTANKAVINQHVNRRFLCQ